MTANTHLGPAEDDHDDEQWRKEDAQDILNTDHEQAILMDLLLQASNGGDLQTLMGRLLTEVQEATDRAYSQGAYE